MGGMMFYEKPSRESPGIACLPGYRAEEKYVLKENGWAWDGEWHCVPLPSYSELAWHKITSTWHNKVEYRETSVLIIAIVLAFLVGNYMIKAKNIARALVVMSLFSGSAFITSSSLDHGRIDEPLIFGVGIFFLVGAIISTYHLYIENQKT